MRKQFIIHLAPLAVLFVTAVAIPACSSETSSGSSSATTASASSSALIGGQPSWVSAEHFVGRMPADAPMRMQLHLQQRNSDHAQTELAAISDPGSPQYGKFLTTEQFAAKYAPTEEDVAVVGAHLEAHGLRVTHVPSNRAFIAAEGSAAQVEQALSTQLGRYMVDSEERHAPLTATTLPDSVASRVRAVLGLTTSDRARPAFIPRNEPDVVGGAGAVDCSKWYAQHVTSEDPPYGEYQYPFPTAPCLGLLPGVLRRAYGLDVAVQDGLDGRGETIAIVDATLLPTLLQDAQEYATRNDPEHPLRSSQFKQVWGPGAPQPELTYWYTEEALDVETVHGVAPGADIVFVSARSDADQDMIAALNLIISDNLASVISNSWSDYPDEVGTSAAVLEAYEQVAVEAGLKGIGLYFATGDGGDNKIYDGVPNPSFPTVLPEVTAVGGTSLGIGADGERLFELGWESSIASRATADGGIEANWSPAAPGEFTAGGGGGTSAIYAQPSYQRGVVPASLSGINGGTKRVIPDVAMVGDPYAGGMLVGRTETGGYTEFFEGGTSLATPFFTSTMILAQQLTHRTFGAANPLLYKAAERGAFIDIRPGRVERAIDLAGASFLTGDLWTLDYRGPENTLETAPGFDNVTGLGVPSGLPFLIAIFELASQPR
jgi:subtilase family serine protease